MNNQQVKNTIIFFYLQKNIHSKGCFEIIKYFYLFKIIKMLIEMYLKIICPRF
jgi:hypothetical protein